MMLRRFFTFALFSIPIFATSACGGPTTVNGVTVHQSGRDKSTVRMVPRQEDAIGMAQMQGTDSPLLAQEGTIDQGSLDFAPQIHTHTARTHIQAAPVVEMAPIDSWQKRYPDAARELGSWVRQNPRAAGFLFQWDAANPDHVEVLTKWAITHRYESIDAFMMTHHDWSTLETLLQRDFKPAIEGYLSWTRRAPEAAVELVNHPKGLAWVGQHVYARELAVAHP